MEAKDNELSARLRLWVVFFLGLTVISLEVVSFQALSFVTDYLTAMRVLSIALIGIAAGGVLSYVAGRHEARLATWLLTFLPLSVLASFWAITRLSPSPLAMMAVLTTPYVIASAVISTAFNRRAPGRVYLYDLVGAGVGALLVLFLVPALREEGSFMLLAVCAVVPAALSLWADARDGQRRWRALTVTALVSALALSGLVVQLSTDRFNMMRTARADYEKSPKKMFKYWDQSPENPGWRLLYSRGSLVERIDIMQRERHAQRGKKFYYSVYNARVVDYIDSLYAPEQIGTWLDNRLPTLLKQGQNPDTLLVGPSGQGLCKAVQSLGHGHIDAVEINPAIANLMTNEMYERSGRAYEGMHLTIGDVRSFLQRTDRLYDFITLLNTRRIWSIGHQGPPEYVHTKEALTAYFTHLKPDGYVLFEERNINEQADLAVRRLIHTAKAALTDLGATDPAKHFAIWELWHNCPRQAAVVNPDEFCKRDYRFTFVMIKRTPITKAETEHLLSWQERLGQRRDKGMGYRGIFWRYLPHHESTHYFGDAVRKASPYSVPGALPGTHDLSIVTDDRPFPTDVYNAPGAAHSVLKDTALLAFLMVLVPCFIAFRGRRQSGTRALLANLLLNPFFAVLGIAYLLVEVVLIQKFGFFLESPAVSMAVILGVLLIASGIGGAASHRLSRRQVGWALSVLVLTIAVAVWLLDPALRQLMGLPLNLRIAVAAIIIAPLGFLMGLPFSFAMSETKAQLSPKHAGLFFGINGAASAVATPLTLILTMEHGFRTTMLIGAGCYLFCALLLSPFLRRV